MKKLKFSLFTVALVAMTLFSVACAEEEEVVVVEEETVSEMNTLETIIDRGMLKCGVNDNLTGFGVVTSDGSFEGFDIDFSKAVAAAILGD